MNDNFRDVWTMTDTPANDDAFVRRAIALAMAGRGRVEPNPMVGCVLVKAERVIGQGIHAKFGEPHAEPTALASCVESAEGATAYVTLEPCCHTNKKTPPCAPRLIEAKVARVVIGCLDPNPDVDGKGVTMLRSAGIIVDRASDDVQVEAKQLIAPFIKRCYQRAPYITLKWAQSVDGRVAGAGGKPRQITGADASRVVHALRARCDAIVVGVNTVLSDDPLLTARDVQHARPLTRVVLDRNLRTPVQSRLVQTARQQRTRVVCSTDTFRTSPRVQELSAQGVEIIAHDDTQGPLLDDTASTWSHVLVEPGPTLARALLPLADRLWVFRSRNSIPEGPLAPDVPDHYVLTGTREMESDVLSEYLNMKSPVFFSATQSADLLYQT